MSMCDRSVIYVYIYIYISIYIYIYIYLYIYIYIRRHCSACRILTWRRGRGPPRTARQFGDVPLNVVFGEPVSQNRGPRLDSPCRLFCWLGLPASFCRKSGKTQCFWTSSLRKRWKNRVFCEKYWGAKGKCKDTYIHTLHYFKYITLQYRTLHYIHTCITLNTLHILHTLHTYIHTYIHTCMHACMHYITLQYIHT